MLCQVTILSPTVCPPADQAHQRLDAIDILLARRSERCYNAAQPGGSLLPGEGERMAMPLLKTKLYIPPAQPDPSTGLVSRPRLIERLNAGARRALTLVCAPAGFGKTTLALIGSSSFHQAEMLPGCPWMKRTTRYPASCTTSWPRCKPLIADWVKRLIRFCDLPGSRLWKTW